MSDNGLILGLGNPGPDYALTRHNAGFMAVDRMVALGGERKGLGLERLECGGDCELWRFYPAGRAKGPWLLAKPLTYMNLSGNAAARICGRFDIAPRDVLVVHDELDLEPGRAKLKRGGGANGHNGILSLEECLGSADFARIRIGIGRPEHASMMVGYVLERFSDTDLKLVMAVIDAVWKSVGVLVRRGWTPAVQCLNAFRAAEKLGGGDGEPSDIPA